MRQTGAARRSRCKAGAAEASLYSRGEKDGAAENSGVDLEQSVFLQWRLSILSNPVSSREHVRCDSNFMTTWRTTIICHSLVQHNHTLIVRQSLVQHSID